MTPRAAKARVVVTLTEQERAAVAATAARLKRNPDDLVRDAARIGIAALLGVAADPRLRSFDPDGNADGSPEGGGHGKR